MFLFLFCGRVGCICRMGHKAPWHGPILLTIPCPDKILSCSPLAQTRGLIPMPCPVLILQCKLTYVILNGAGNYFGGIFWLILFAVISI